MASKQVRESGENNPLRNIRIGRFKISIWRFKKLLSNGSKDEVAYIEQWVDVDRACIQYSTKNRATGQWENQSIWCPAEELRSLAAVVDQFNDLDEEEDSSSPDEKDGKEVAGFSSTGGEKPGLR